MSDDTKPPALHPLLAARRSSYAFDSRPLSRDEIHLLFEAARWAPSSFNEQPWRFLFATREQPAHFDRLAGVLLEWNRAFAGRAPLIGLSAAKLAFAKNGRANAHAIHDVGLASQNIALQAVAMGLQMFMVAGFDVDAARALIGPTEEWVPVAMFAIGFPGKVEDLVEPYRTKEQRPRTRHAIEEIVFEGEWGKGIS